MAISIPSEVEARVEQAAARQGIDTEAFVVAAIEKELHAVETPVRNGSTEPALDDVFAGLIGGFHFGDTQLSENTGEKFAELLMEKHRQGDL